MNDDVKVCVDARVNFFGQYCEVSDALRPEVDAFIRDAVALGEASADAAEFEARFVSSGLSAAFNGLVTRCAPKAYQMTEADRQRSRETMQQMMREDRGDLIRGAAEEIAGTAATYGKSALITARRNAMIENGTFRDYTVATNRIEDAGRLAKGLKSLFKKKD